MPKILVIAEKPSVGRDIAKVLGCAQKGEGYLAGEDYIVSWAVGHLAELCAPEDYDPAWKRWQMATLPIVPGQMRLKPAKGARGQLAVLKRLMNSPEVASLICATDSGREGELIFRYIYQLCGCSKPFERLWVSSMTDKAIRDGFAALRPGGDYDRLYESARCRSEADWLVGINASRAYTLKYNTLLSVGRVQTPTLAIIVARAREIAAFVPEEYYEVRADFGEAAGESPGEPLYWGLWQDAKGSSRIGDGARARALAAKVKGQPGRVRDIQREEKSQPPPLLYDLTELQRDCNRRYGFSAQKTLELAQSLYESKKLLTYPRTDSRYLSDDLLPRLPGRIQRLGELSQFAAAAKPLLAALEQRSLPPPGRRVIDNSKVSDHHAIIPTEGRLRLDRLSPEEFLVFRLVALRFLAVFYPAYVYAVTKVFTEAAGELFLSRGQEILQPGWQQLYFDLRDQEAKGSNNKNKKEKKEEQQLPRLAQGQEVAVLGAAAARKKTQPPKPYTEAGLLSAMENAGRFVEDEALREQLKAGGLGTPATRAAIIERLLQVGYIKRQAKALVPTEKGEKLVEVAPAELVSAETTGKWERGLGAIAEGRMDTRVFMASILRYVDFLVRDCKSSTRRMEFPPEPKRTYKKKAAGQATKNKAPK